MIKSLMKKMMKVWHSGSLCSLLITDCAECGDRLVCWRMVATAQAPSQLVTGLRPVL